MIIAVNTRLFSTKYISVNYIEETLIAFAKENPQYQFIFFTNVAIEGSLNILPVLFKPTSNPLSVKLWQSIQLPALLKKYTADILIDTQQVLIKPLVPQLLFVENVPSSAKIKKNNIASIEQAKKIITTSVYLKNKIIALYKTDSKKIEAFYLLPGNKFITADHAQKQSTLKKYTDEKEYFLFAAEVYDEKFVINLLKAFSVFKKWQKSNLQLIIACKKKLSLTPFTQSLKNYKYKNEVVIVNCTIVELANITSSAYCVIYHSKENIYLPLLQALQCHVPVITTMNELNKEICNDAALYSDADNFDAIAKNMILVYKNETSRNELIKKGELQLQRIRSAHILPQLTHIIQQALQA